MPLVEFKHVEKYYGDYHALRDINLTFEKGQVVVLLGPSGSGKSTLIRTINGLEAIDKGSLVVDTKLLAPVKRIWFPYVKRSGWSFNISTFILTKQC